MKRCPECRRDYHDDTLLYCLDDGNALLEGPASGKSEPPASAGSQFGDEPTTAILHETAAKGDSLEEDTRHFDRSPTSQTGQSSAEYLLGEIRKRKATVLFASIILTILIGGVALAVYEYYGSSGTPTAFQKFTVNRVTTSGRALEASISPDGKYIVYLEMSDDGIRNLSIRQTATGDTIPIVPGTKGNILRSTTFSPDGNFVYYLFSDRTKGLSLYQVSSLGGTPKKLLDRCEGTVAVSPDGKRIAFVRYEGQSKSSIFLANADGTGERSLASLENTEWFTEAGPSWSADGNTIAVTGGVSENGVDAMQLLGIDVESGSVSKLSDKRWAGAGRVVWVPDGNSLILTAAERTDELGMQAWRVSYPSGEAARITNDVHGHDDTSLGITADGLTLLLVTRQNFSRIESIPASGDTSRTAKLTTSDSNQEGFLGFDLLPDGRVVFSSFQDGKSDLWVMNADGSGRRRLTSDAFWEGDPTVSPDGRYVVFRSNRPDGQAIARLWRMDSDGGNMVQLSAMAHSAPEVSPDGRSVIFSAWDEVQKMPSLWRVGIDGGDPVRQTDLPIRQTTYSPDGQWIGGYSLDETASRWRYGIVPASGGPPVRQFDFPGFQYQSVRWTPDGRHLSHIGAPPDPSNIWLQNTEGGEPRRLTDFTTNYIFRHEWSRDGKTLMMARGRPAFDVVLLKDER